MQLTRYTDYALRVLIYLALQDKEQRSTINDIAENFSVSRNHLLKVVHHLGQLGYLDNTRGKGGGIRLGALPASIRIGDVVRKMESNLDLIDCNSPPCPIRPHCLLKGSLHEACEAFLKVLDQYTLEDMILQPQQLRDLLRHG